MHCPRDSFESITLDLGDCIGVESCLDLKTNVDIASSCGVQKAHHHHHHHHHHHRGSGSGNGRSSSDQRLEKTERVFPPPIRWLACTENMPWIMKRYYTNDGRLIIRREKVKRHEYFQADRSNGRLTLLLVPINDDELDDDDDRDGDDKIGFIDSEVGSDKMDGYDGEREDRPALEEESRILDHAAGGLCMENWIGGIGSGGGGGRGKFYKYCSMSRSSWMFGEIAEATIRSVHT